MFESPKRFLNPQRTIHNRQNKTDITFAVHYLVKKRTTDISMANSVFLVCLNSQLKSILLTTFDLNCEAFCFWPSCTSHVSANFQFRIQQFEALSHVIDQATRRRSCFASGIDKMQIFPLPCSSRMKNRYAMHTCVHCEQSRILKWKLIRPLRSVMSYFHG